jgi:hypothetical protein
MSAAYVIITTEYGFIIQVVVPLAWLLNYTLNTTRYRIFRLSTALCGTQLRCSTVEGYFELRNINPVTWFNRGGQYRYATSVQMFVIP